MLHLERLRMRIVDLIDWMGHTESLHELSFGTQLLRPIPLSCFDIVSCKPRSAQHQRHWLSTPFRSYGGALRVAPESSLEVARKAHRLDLRQGHELKLHHHTIAWH